MNTYFISGLGANCSVFDRIELPTGFQKHYIEWLQPYKNEAFSEYVKRMGENIDTTQPFILIGLSFGGIIAQEISNFKKPEKLILISTIKNDGERPFLFKFSNWTKVHRFVPISFITSDGVISYAFFRKLYSKNLPKFHRIFTYRNPYYLKWSFENIVQWRGTSDNQTAIFHIHGSKDPLFPISKIQNPIEIHNGNHLMIIMKPKKVSEEIQNILNS